MRLDKLVAERFGLSRRQAQAAVWHGRVDLAGETCCEPGCAVEPDVSVSYWPNRPRPEAAARRLTVLYEDRDILIVDKPAGLLTAPTAGRERDTLLERAGRYLARTRALARPYVGIVHRLDVDTTGVILLACSPQALRPLQALFRAHAVERRYVAVVEGLIEPASGTIDLPLVADRGDGRRGAARVPGEGIRAVTHYEVMGCFGGVASHLACRLETGRTHQIRIHLAEIGHSVVGDPTYRSRTRPPFPVPFSRQALHAHTLGIVHPVTGQSLRVEAPLPPDIGGLITTLRDRFGGSASRTEAVGS